MIIRPLRSWVLIVACLLPSGLVAFASPQDTIAKPPLRPTHQANAKAFLAKRGWPGKQAATLLMQGRAASKRSANVREGIDPALATPTDSLLSQPWQPLGPAQISTTVYGLVTGRVSSIAVDPSDPTGNTIYVGTSGGGVWKSTTAAGPPAAVSFAPLTDDLPAFNQGDLASLSIGALSVQTGGTGVILAGTGDPNDALDSYYGSGILRSADGGLSWSLIANSNDLSVNSLTNFYFVGNAFAAFAWSVQSPNLVVAAVSQSAQGELVGATDLQSYNDIPRSVAGLYYSIDAGQTWLMATITDGPGRTVQTGLIPVAGGGNAATAVVWNPIRRRFYAAIRFHGYYESADGITFTRLSNQPGAGLTSTECPTNPNSIGSQACPLFRGALAVQPSTGDMFALSVDGNLLDQGLWQDVCSASSRTCVSNTVTFSQPLSATALENGQGAIFLGDYSLVLAAVPSTGDTLLFAGTQDIYRCSLAAGCVFRNTTNTNTCTAALVAPFQHAIDTTFAGGLSLMYFGNDSGLWRSTDDVGQTMQTCLPDDANHFQNLNNGIGSLAEVNAFAQDPTDSAIILAGIGVNGSAASSTASQNVWPQVLDGNGSYVAIDPSNPENWYAQSSIGVGIDLCASGSSCTPAAFGTPVIGFAQVGPDAYASSEGSPFILDPLNSANLILGTCHVWWGPADGASWSLANQLSELYPGEGPTCAGNGLLQSMAASSAVSTSETNTELIYAGMSGVGLDGPQAYAGHLFEATGINSRLSPAAWTDISASPVTNDLYGFNPADFSVSSITLDPHDPTGQTVYATIQGFDTILASTGSVYASTNAGVSWLNITSNLPGVPANSIAIDPNDANTVYVAIDTGVYITTAVTSCSVQNCWSLYGSGLPNSPVIQLATFNHAGQSLLRAGTYGRGIWQIPLITAAAAEATAATSPSSLSFAEQQVQTQSGAQTVTVTNTGTIPLIVAQTPVTGDFAAANGCSGPVAIGSGCTVQVTFTPTMTGVRSGKLTIYANVAQGQLTVPVSGTGLPGASVVLLPTSMNFGATLVGSSAIPPQNITISNTGGVAATLGTPVVTGDFSIVANTCSATLAPNFGCTVAIAFTPTLSGPRPGVFSISDSQGTQSATLLGNGVAPATDGVAPSALAFALQTVGTSSTPQVVILANSGDSPLNSVSASVTGDFQVVNGCGETLIGHSTCAFSVTYSPKQVGVENGVLTINDMYGKPQNVALSGLGLAPSGISVLPSAINFGTEAIGVPSPAQTVTVTNSGGIALGALTLAVQGPFSIVSTSCTSTLATGGNCSAQVEFLPTLSGLLSGTLTVGSSSIDNPLQVALSGDGFGFTLQPNGASSATVTAGQTANYLLQIIPDSGSTGMVSITCGSSPPGSDCIVNPSSVQLTSGVTTTVAVSIATGTLGATGAYATATTGKPSRGTALVLIALCLPFALLRFPATRRKGWWLAWVIVIAATPLGCGVSASVGKTSASTGGNPISTPSATYNPVVTATGSGATQSVQLTLVVE
ncbi:hypothetical protein ACPOL_1568 [Acidisarcina polymorpha]|uniref:HYDIN/VesB/CFA65-like Ig-like domain-containing protein n=1 Tax=Acidisarcina polymorpha TaxID=2211140 RepID=A0A2Z5FWM2_9BACT|nr:choice-of-anchor D domain-containing protein [Acidisarcina polymorpha]AXC10914.1 hypothetical protein ACPOL_1568 [Acidisarcina polymorpha]